MLGRTAPRPEPAQRRERHRRPARPAVGAATRTEKEGFEPSRQGFSPPNALAGRRLQPLGHFSGPAQDSRRFSIDPQVSVDTPAVRIGRREVAISNPEELLSVGEPLVPRTHSFTAAATSDRFRSRPLVEEFCRAS